MRFLLCQYQWSYVSGNHWKFYLSDNQKAGITAIISAPPVPQNSNSEIKKPLETMANEQAHMIIISPAKPSIRAFIFISKQKPHSEVYKVLNFLCDHFILKALHVEKKQ